MKKIGFTTSFPVEVIFAAGHTPIDLNNIFVLNKPEAHVKNAELQGFPAGICAWIKGMYSVINRNHMDTVIGIVEGDCSNTHSLMSILADEGVDVRQFSYFYSKNREALDREIANLEREFGVTRQQTMAVKRQLDEIRKRLVVLDTLTYCTNQVTGAQNHSWLVTSSDFNGDPVQYAHELEAFIQQASEREALPSGVRLGFVGVPPILSDIYSFIEECGGRIVFNEVQRQFSMPYMAADIVEQYLQFTYPYDIFGRIQDIKQAMAERQIDGLIAYTQSFCHRQLDIISLKRHLDLPILQVEADKPGVLDSRTKLRLESFLEMIIEKPNTEQG